MKVIHKTTFTTHWDVDNICPKYRWCLVTLVSCYVMLRHRQGASARLGPGLFTGMNFGRKKWRKIFERFAHAIKSQNRNCKKMVIMSFVQLFWHECQLTAQFVTALMPADVENLMTFVWKRIFTKNPSKFKNTTKFCEIVRQKIVVVEERDACSYFQPPISWWNYGILQFEAFEEIGFKRSRWSDSRRWNSNEYDAAFELLCEKRAAKMGLKWV